MGSKIAEAFAIASPGDLVVFEFTRNVSGEELNAVHQMLKRVEAETGVHFLIIGEGARIARIEKGSEDGTAEAPVHEHRGTDGSELQPGDRSS